MCLFITGKKETQNNVVVRKRVETSFSVILLVIVAVFLCCQLPRLVLNMVEFAGLDIEAQTDP